MQFVSQTGPWMHRLRKLVSHVKALETFAVVSESQIGSLAEQVHALAQEAVQQQETERSSQKTAGSLEALRGTKLAEDARCVAGSRRGEDSRRATPG